MTPLEVPAASRDPVHHADWIELEALRSSDGVCSYTEFAAKMHASATMDALIAPEDDDDSMDRGGEQSAEVANSAWKEIETRFVACGGEGGKYPFDLSEGAITLVSDWKKSCYIFQMLLSKFGYRAGPEGSYGDRLFESISCMAVQEYFGGDANGAQVEKFGFPREDRSNFGTALQAVCERMNAGSSVKMDALGISDQKDSHLDVLAWRPFDDRRPSQLIGFGQCATGKDWDNAKLTELQPVNFQRMWLQGSIDPDPVRMFFVPHTIESNKWRKTSIRGGIIFDRCRISQLAAKLESGLATSLSRWTTHVAKHRLGI